jgi:hypothetical protein
MRFSSITLPVAPVMIKVLKFNNPRNSQLFILQCQVSHLDQRLQPKLDTRARQTLAPQMVQWGYPLVLQPLVVHHPMVQDPPQPVGQLQ